MLYSTTGLYLPALKHNCSGDEECYFDNFSNKTVIFIHKSDNEYMKNPNRNIISRLDELPNVGNKIAEKLRLVDIKHPKELIGEDLFKLHAELCINLGKNIDPCVIDVFMSAIHFMEDGEPLPWWKFTDKRKKHMTEQR